MNFKIKLVWMILVPVAIMSILWHFYHHLGSIVVQHLNTFISQTINHLLNFINGPRLFIFPNSFHMNCAKDLWGGGLSDPVVTIKNTWLVISANVNFLIWRLDVSLPINLHWVWTKTTSQQLDQPLKIVGGLALDMAHCHNLIGKAQYHSLIGRGHFHSLIGTRVDNFHSLTDMHNFHSLVDLKDNFHNLTDMDTDSQCYTGHRNASTNVSPASLALLEEEP